MNCSGLAICFNFQAGWSHDEQTAQLATDALIMAICTEASPTACDQDSQYKSKPSQRLMTDDGVTCSMSRSGNGELLLVT